jgi:hypothetical protein
LWLRAFVRGSSPVATPGDEGGVVSDEWFEHSPTVAESHRQEIIGELLRWYIDVLNGVRDGVGDDPTHLLLMCRAWNSPAYRELERLLPLLTDAEPSCTGTLPSATGVPAPGVCCGARAA